MIKTLYLLNFKTYSFRSSKGFTLIEIMAVILLVGLMTSMVISRTGFKKNKTNVFHEHFASLSREVFLKARLTNTTYRLVFKIPDTDKEGKSVQVYAEQKQGSEFKIDEGKLIKGLEFPDTIKYIDFLSDLKENEEESQEEEVKTEEEERTIRERFFYKYIYFLPEGFVSDVAVHFEQNENPWTFSIDSLTGKVRLKKGHLKIEDLNP